MLENQNLTHLSCLVPEWPAPANVHALTTLRSLSVEHADNKESVHNQYDNLNLALHVSDQANRVTQLRQLLSDSLILPKQPHWLTQVHGTECLNIDEISQINSECVSQADAAFTLSSDQVCVVMSADCLPLLVTDKKGQGVLAIHAGWRGLVAGIISKSIKKFIHALKITTNDCLVWLGPAISQKHFEVGKEVKQSFQNFWGSSAIDSAFIEHATEYNKFYCDLYQLARIELRHLGIESICGGNQCTYDQEDRYFSYRRASDQGMGNCGRMATLIWKTN